MPSPLQPMEVHGATVRIFRPHTKTWEINLFDSAEEAQARMLFVDEELDWFRTPFVDCAAIKGPKGGVDCLMLKVRAAVDTKLVAPFDPRPYPPRWMMKRGAEERLLNGVLALGAVEVETPRFGDISLFQFGWCYSHAATTINSDEYFHAYAFAGMCLTSPKHDSLLNNIALAGREFPRPVKHFDIWGKR